MANNKRVISNTKTKCKIGDFITLSSEESHHLLNVLRLKIDNLVEVLLDNSGQCFLAKITKDKVIAEIEILEEIKTKQPKNIQKVLDSIGVDPVKPVKQKNEVVKQSNSENILNNIDKSIEKIQ